LYYFLQVIKYLSYSRYLPPQENRRVSKDWGAIDAKVDLAVEEVYYSDSDPEEDEARATVEDDTADSSDEELEEASLEEDF
jgi:hypothetical protein